MVDVDKQKAGLYGLTGAEIAKTVRLAIAGLDAGAIKNEEGDEFKINVSVSKF